MGRLFAALRADPETHPAANPAKVAKPPRLAGVGFADSQDSQTATVPALDRFADSQDSQACASESALHRFASANGIDWSAARSQMTEGDAQAGAAQLVADSGDGIELAGVACWLRLLAERAPAAHEPFPTGYRTNGTGRDTYGRPLAPLVHCGDCQHFTRNRDNPEAGVGTCVFGEPDVGQRWPHLPGARRCCERYVAIEAQTPVTPAMPVHPPQPSPAGSN